MRSALIAALAAAFAVSACATATSYAPQGYGGQRGGYSEMRLEENRWRVHFAGNSLTSRDTVEMYLLYRAAELTLEQGYDWFAAVHRATDRDTRYVGSPDPWFHAGYGRYWGPSWRFHRRGYWSMWDPYWGQDFDVREVSRYEAVGEIVMGRGPKPQDDPIAFDAREVIANLGPRVARPAPR